MEERIQKILADWGIASRRGAEKMILARRVKLNGYLVTLGQKADMARDTIEVDGKKLTKNNCPQLVYLLLNKPKGVVCTCFDPENRPTVIDLLPRHLRLGIHPVGRLDFNSTGALILTNDGEVTLALTHPRYHLAKTYQVWLNGHPSETILKKWREGVILDGKITLPASIKVVQKNSKHTLLQIVLTEGRNRQIRRVAQQFGFSVLKLHRIAIGEIRLQPVNESVLPSGDYRFLNDIEMHFLETQVHLVQSQLALTI